MTDLNIIVGVRSGDAIRQLSNVQKGVDNVGVATKKTTQQLKQHATQYNKTAVAANKLGKGVAQQAGYQFADFAVQIQNGTSAMQAFGQQGSQLLAIFGPAGAIAGAAVAIGSAFYTAFAGATTSVSTFKDEIKDLNEELDVLRLGAGSAGQYALITQINEAAKALEDAKRELEQVAPPTDLSSMSTPFTDPAAASAEAAKSELATAQKLVKEKQNELDELIRIKQAKEIVAKLGNSEVQEAQNLADNQRRLARERKVENDKRIGRMQHMDELSRKFYARQLAEEARLSAARNRQFSNEKSSIETQLRLITDEVSLRKIHTNEAYIQERLERNKVKVLAEAKGLNGAQVEELLKLTTQLQTQKRDLEDILELERSRAFFAKEIADKQKEAHDALAASFGKGEDEKKSPVGRAKTLAKVIKNELSPAAQRLVDLSDSIGSSFEGAMMSAVRGTMSVKDAFRTMAADIIAELYRVFVVKQITGFISDAIMGGMGYTPVQGGGYTMRPRARPRAAGGPVSAGSPYLVGERGPELIVPNRSGTVIPNNKLGGGAVVVNQTINVTTGVQQTVRAEIRQLMPQIADSAKAAVSDAKRRGGSYGRAFA